MWTSYPVFVSSLKFLDFSFSFFSFCLYFSSFLARDTESDADTTTDADADAQTGTAEDTDAGAAWEETLL